MVTRVLLTGGNGFVGAHILSQLLAKDISVRAVVRSQAKAEQVKRDNPVADNQLDFAIVPDITAPGAFDKAFDSEKPFDTVIHTASPFLYGDDLKPEDFLNPAVLGTTEILKATKAKAPDVRRVIVCSSFASIVTYSLPVDSGKVYNENDWNPISWAEAMKAPQVEVYSASKKFAEEAAWDFVKDEKPSFDLTVLCPPMVYGGFKHTIRKIADLNQSNQRIWDLFINSSKDAPLPDNGLHLYVDVRDIARAHVLSATTPGAANQRIAVCGGQLSSQFVSDVLRKNFPELDSRTPVGKPGRSSLPDGAFDLDTTRSKQILGLEYEDPEKTVVDLARELLEIEKQENSS
ncbi:MAG: methylglyoxal reductase (NADPH-dependent) gre2 [Piccolia ochrophora]|nr:MAG: methylglyoxal reductase (NADPH-dependent) gre2 [Piccolia ochrophora]